MVDFPVQTGLLGVCPGDVGGDTSNEGLVSCPDDDSDSLSFLAQTTVEDQILGLLEVITLALKDDLNRLVLSRDGGLVHLQASDHDDSDVGWLVS